MYYYLFTYSNIYCVYAVCMVLLSSFTLNMYKCKIPSLYYLTCIKLGCEVRGIDLKIENRQKVIQQIKNDVTKHRLLIFKDQGIVSGEQHIEITKWFGEISPSPFKHSKSPNLDLITRISNDPEEGCLAVGRKGWHIDGTYEAVPFAYSLYFMASIPRKGATAFAPLTEILDGLSVEKRNDWDRLWAVININHDDKTSHVHPLIYPHPVTGRNVMCLHPGYTKRYIWDYKTPTERLATDEEFDKINNDINYEFIKDNEAIQYKHHWEQGDFIISDNLAVAHIATPETQYPRSEVGLRVLHRTTVNGVSSPTLLKLKSTGTGCN